VNAVSEGKVGASLSSPAVTRIDAWLTLAAAQHPQAEAIVSPSLRKSYAELDLAVSRGADELLSRGIHAGERVLLRGGNSAELWLTMLALWRAGCSAVPTHPALPWTELERIATECGAKHCLSDAASFERQGGLLLDSLLAFDETPTSLSLSAHETSLDEACVLFTSGTTGEARGVALTHAGLLHNQRVLAEHRPLYGSDRYLHVAPLYHVAGLEFALGVLAAAGCHVFREHKPAEALLAALQRERISVVFLVPTLLQRLLSLEGFVRGTLPDLRLVVYGGAPIELRVLARAIDALGDVLCQGYGLTEASGAVTILTTARHRLFDPRVHATCGTPLPGIEVRIALADGRDAPIGQSGEVLLRGAAITPSTAPDGWLATGDIGRLTESGDLQIVDRKKDVIISGGENIASREVEALLSEHPSVAAVAVIGEASAQWGEQVVAVVVKQDGHVTSDADLIAFAKARGARFRAPKRVVFMSELPCHASGKVDKRALRRALLT
jgi:acyl-CoA synthetase (AMP-forming)/AMP-acid ligase II